MKEINHSQIAEWNTCRWRYDLRYNKGYESPRLEIPPALGSAIHAGLAAWGEGRPASAGVAEYEKTAKDLVATEYEQDALEGIMVDALRVVRNTIAFLPSDWIIPYDPKGVPLVEYKVQTRVKGYGLVYGTIDAVIHESSTGYNWLVDYKTSDRIVGDMIEDTNLQMAMYQYMLSTMGIEVAGSIRLQIRTRVPARPSINKNGTVSRAAIVTDWPTYLQAVMEAGQDPADYEDMRIKLESKLFHKIIKNYRSQEEVKNIWDRVVLKALKAARSSSRIEQPRALGGFSCRSCWAREACLADLRGHDFEGVLDTLARAGRPPVLDIMQWMKLQDEELALDD